MRFAVAVGGNRGDVVATAQRAEGLLGPLVLVVARSSWHRTQAVGGPPGQGDFHNAAWIVATTLGPHGLLDRLLAVEEACGRTRCVHHGPRRLDLDLLLAEDPCYRCNDTRLQLPHPRLAARSFVLEPLHEIASSWILSPQGPTIAELYRRLPRGTAP